MKEILIAGHYCHDTLLLPKGVKSETLGGSVSYVSSIFSALDVKFSVVSKVGTDFQYYEQIRHLPRVSELKKTTHFISDLAHGERTEKVSSVCEPIFPQEIPDQTFKIALGIGIIGELPPATLEKMASLSHYLICDAQGLIRDVLPDGRVVNRPLSETPYAGLMKKVAVLKASRKEADLIPLEAIREHTCILVTEGAEGCTVITKENQYQVPALSVEEVDPTGAGDCFLAGFSAALSRGMPLDKAVEVGNYFGALAVQHIGVPKVETIPVELEFPQAEQQFGAILSL